MEGHRPRPRRGSPTLLGVAVALTPRRSSTSRPVSGSGAGDRVPGSGAGDRVPGSGVETASPALSA
ncbi:hypothetical protein GCM10010246_14830 [Streptomyces cuspidosporus]|uniref:Uncharacterized protein n=1 Tax=Streptomyces cuspidosporus TaxID=66882 RepID=A0ABP5SMT1_9ACTN